MRLAALILALAAALPSATQALPRPPLFQAWNNGTDVLEPYTQVQRYDEDTFVVRQSVRTNFEAPFLYLLFGKNRVLLLDTGAGGLAGGFKVRPTIDAVIADWQKAHHRTSIPLVVAHSHGHGDHHMGDAEFKDRPDTTVVGLAPADVAAFFKIADWPHDIVKYDLGGRVLDIIPTPGHQPSHIMVFDEKTRLLLSGDTLYPGRLYVPSNMFGDFKESIDRVVAFTKGRHVSHVLGAHIEMTYQPGKDYPDAAPTHPAERVLQLPYSDLLELQAAVHKMGDSVVKDVHDDFIVFPLPPRPPERPKTP
jgi:glyoxylase-like metal-dependent hydrolase (beta-lactamase superfamily II)